MFWRNFRSVPEEIQSQTDLVQDMNSNCLRSDWAKSNHNNQSEPTYRVSQKKMFLFNSSPISKRNILGEHHKHLNMCTYCIYEPYMFNTNSF